MRMAIPSFEHSMQTVESVNNKETLFPAVWFLQTYKRVWEKEREKQRQNVVDYDRKQIDSIYSNMTSFTWD